MKTRYVVGFYFTPNQSMVWLILKTHPDWQRNHLNGVGGRINENEEPMAAMVREFEEEAGLFIERWHNFAIVSGEHFELHCFSAFGDQQPTSQTDERIYSFNVEPLPPSIVPNAAWLIPMALSFTRGEHCKAFEVKEMENE